MASHASGQDSLIGVELGRYRILDRVGVGGMGEVYRARDQHLARDVAIKVLPSGTLINEAARKRFHKEAQILSRLNHPNIATIYDFDTQQGLDMLVMELVSGNKLSEKMTKPLPEKEILSLGVQLAEGLSAAHELGIVHRDLKPDNLRLSSDQRLKILDFGLAKLLPQPTSLTTESHDATPAMAGTLPYMAPEQLRGQEIDARTDIYAAGCVLYQMATARRPYPEVETFQLISAILHRPLLPPGAINHELSPELARVIAKCMEKEPEDRYQSAKELAIDLRRFERGSEVYASGHAWPIAYARPNRRKTFAAVAMAIVAIALIAGSLWYARARRAAHAANITPSIAVLPFADLSPQKDQEYFSDGLAEEMLDSLAKIQDLHVAARSSSFQFKGEGEDLRSIGQKLNVAAVLEGSVRKQGKRVRISVQLVKVSDGFQLWSQVYDRDLTDIFAVQEEIARSVASSLRLTLLGQKAPAPRATNIDAYNDYLEGKYFYARPTKENLEHAISYYEQAIVHDATYAPAWAALSLAHSVHAGAYGPVQEFTVARDAAQRALALDPNLADGYAALGEIKLEYEWDWAGAYAAYQRALALEKGNADIVERAASVAATLNHFDEAMQLSRRAVELDPLRVMAHDTLAFNAWWAGRLDEAEAAAHKGLELYPQFPWLHALLARVYLARSRPQEALAEAQSDTDPIFHLQDLALVYRALGRNDEADKALAELVSRYSTTAAFQIAEVYAFRGQADDAFTWLDRAYQQHDGGLTFAKGDPLLANLKNDPRYIAFLKKIHLA